MSKTIGFYGGKFAPLHNGHIYSLVRASGMVDELHVIVCYDEESEINELFGRSKIPYIHYSQRERWVREITKDMPNVFVHSAYNKNTMDFDDWVEGAEEIKKVIGKEITHIFSSEPSYDIYFKQLYKDAEHIIIDEKRMMYNISATKLRTEGVYKYWDMLPKVVQKYFVKKVVIVGTESCGKSVLTRNLATLYNTNFVEEHGRAYYEELNDYENFYMEDYIKIAYRQKYHEELAMKDSNKVVFFDTEAVVTLRFALQYNKEDSQLLREIINNQKYDLWLFLEQDVPFVEDGTRKYVKEREYSNRLLKQLLDEHGIEYITVSGSYDERLMKSMSYVDKLIK